MSRAGELGAFLRSRRSQLAPSAAEQDANPRPRRVPGLRRAEVARRAGISTEYYIRLEQGRGGVISPQVLDSLAGALQLDDIESAHLYHLVQARPMSRVVPDAGQQVRRGIHLLVGSLGSLPVYVVGRRTNLLIGNPLAEAVLPGAFDAGSGRNLARYVLLDPAAREVIRNWTDIAAASVAVVRLEAGQHPEDRALADLVGELMVGCPEFAGWWSTYRVHQRSHDVIHVRNEMVGDMSFFMEAFPIPTDPDQTLCIYNVEPGTVTADRVTQLAQLVRKADEGMDQGPDIG